jgi:hypothetical protein
MPLSQTPPRNDRETITCPVCGKTARRTGRRRYCSDPCRQTAWRRRATPLADPQPVLTARSRKTHTVYQCTDCDSRYLGEQWCPDCVRPCRRLGPGGHCECGEILTIEELLANN